MNAAAKNRIRRFTLVQRLFHFLLIVCFLFQSASGLSRMYIETAWGKHLSSVFGGYESALILHKYVGIFMLIGLLIHVLYLVSNLNRKNVLGPDSLLPQFRDVKDFFHHTGWMLGIADMPKFEKWGYWEKFDYWAVFWGMAIIGGTGLLLAFSIESSRIMPGWGLNVAFWVHRIEAVLAMAHVFIIHFFIAHFRPHNFPMDRTMFEGSVDPEGIRHEKPLWIGRMESEGKLKEYFVPEAGTGIRVLSYVFGYSAVGIGVYLLIGGLSNFGNITW